MTRYYTTGEAAKVLGYSREQIRLWIKEDPPRIHAGKPSGKPKGHHRISETALLLFQKHFDPDLGNLPGD